MSDTQNKQGEDQRPVFRTAAELMQEQTGQEAAAAVEFKPDHAETGLTVVYGLEEIPDSTAPADVHGNPVAHVRGPGMNACDPIAAGLYRPAIGKPGPGDNRAITRTGEIGAGPRPFTYVEKTGSEMVPQAAPPDNATVPQPAPEQSGGTPAPSDDAPRSGDPPPASSA